MKINKLSLIVMLFLIGAMFFPTAKAMITASDLDVTLLTQYPDPARAGDTMELRFNVQNNGDTYATNVLVEVIPEYPFSLVPGETVRQEINNLLNWPEEGNFKTLMYRLLVNSNALDGQHEIKVRYSINNGNSWITQLFNIDVTSKEFAEIIYIDKTKVTPGQETEMTFTVNNIGNAPLQNMIFSWYEENNVVLPVNTDNTRYIKYLAPGDKTDLKYVVIASVNAEPDLYMLNLELEYDTTNGSGSGVKETITTQAGVFVGGETDFDVAFSESSNGETSFSIANIGSVPAYSVSVQIPPQQGWKVIGSNSMIIGNLNKGDYTLASFSLQSAMSKSMGAENQKDKESFIQDSQVVNVQVIYTDTMGKRNTVEKEVSLNPFNLIAGTIGSGGTGTNVPGSFSGRKGMLEQESFFSKYQWWIISIIVFVILFFEYKRYGKRKNKELKFFSFIKIEIKTLFVKIKSFFRKRK